MAHVQVNSAVTRCVDPRLTDQGRNLADQFRENNVIDDYSFAGGGANATATMDAVNVSVNAHGVKKVVLVGHENCAWAAAQGITTDDDIKNLVKKTAEAVSKQYPDIQVVMKFMKLNGEVTGIQ